VKSGTIDTENFSRQLRTRAIDLRERRVKMTKFQGSEQEKDLSFPPNCHGFGRLHHFRRQTSLGWPDNPLPLEPASRALEVPAQEELQVQVFQNAVCNWRCWYCYVDFSLLSANPLYSSFVSAEQLVEWYLEIPTRPSVIDLSGGQPDLVPEWTVWMMKALVEQSLEDSVFLWGDDNLSNDYFWQFLSAQEIELISTYRNYARVCCFKGFDCESFSFNTKAHPDLYRQQLELFRRLLSTGIDLYAYVTLTGPDPQEVKEKIPRFLDELQRIHHNLPLRTVPLEIQFFTPMKTRIQGIPAKIQETQQAAVEVWTTEIEGRFSAVERARKICDIPLS
jgi:uncharacterized Fe-S cluster-containing radical SAM superfamily protein